jgi:hypothetical protein
MKTRKMLVFGLNFLILLLLLNTKLEAHHFGNTIARSTTRGSEYELTVLVDSTTTEIHSNFFVDVELFAIEFDNDSVKFSNVKIYTKFEGGAFEKTESSNTSDIEIEYTGSSAGFLVNVSINVAAQFDVYGRAEFFENVTGSDEGIYQDSGWFKAHTISVGAEETNFTSTLILAITLIGLALIWRMLKRSKKSV